MCVYIYIFLKGATERDIYRMADHALLDQGELSFPLFSCKFRLCLAVAAVAAATAV